MGRMPATWRLITVVAAVVAKKKGVHYVEL
jgi:hypothetical protein